MASISADFLLLLMNAYGKFDSKSMTIYFL